ncbi:hypothetical protein [Paralysiella testudinis]|uniref:Uncharacterized protein n=1 Tax=Paralysiella testudinis TaxID=2809020 RepID=A0A892ZDT2_9NEIS|nr:hypothetical protein [Paralysiella testudinis]QRQ81102.1 hypothetical protein JQU52_10265 [Paralysiella testudinis]QRQ82098.1 hypothetical protein JQU52_01260 [Paralysiella testudinis]
MFEIRRLRRGKEVVIWQTTGTHLSRIGGLVCGFKNPAEVDAKINQFLADTRTKYPDIVDIAEFEAMLDAQEQTKESD